MKRLLLFALLTALLTACNDNMENPLTPTQKKIAELMAGYDGKIDMAAFLAAAQQGIWQFDTIDTTYTNGETYDGIKDGSTDLHTMMLRSDGECRIMLSFMFNPAIPRLYQPITWNVSASQPNTIELYSEKIEQKAATYQYDQYAARTTLELLYYKDGEFIMRGMQPFAYNGGMTSKGIYKSYCTVCGHIITDKETVEKYLSYEEYEAYRAQHPEMF